MLINYWPFEDDTKDHIGNGSDPGGGISTINGRKCRGDWFGVDFGWRLNNDYTITMELCRVRGVADWSIDYALLSSADQNWWGIGTSDESGLLKHQWDHDTQTNASIKGKETWLNFNYNDNKWHHYELHSTGNEVELYIDGKYWWTGYDGVRPGSIIFGNAGSHERGGVYVRELKVYNRATIYDYHNLLTNNDNAYGIKKQGDK